MISLPDLIVPYRSQPAEVLLTILVWGEARGEPDQGKLAVAEVVRNRVEHPRRWPDDWNGVMLQRKHFSIFNPGNPSLGSLHDLFEGDNRQKALDLWRSCGRAAAFVYFAKPWLRHKGISHGADHYHSTSVKPSWSMAANGQSKEPCQAIGQHLFYCLG